MKKLLIALLVLSLLMTLVVGCDKLSDALSGDENTNVEDSGADNNQNGGSGSEEKPDADNKPGDNLTGDTGNGDNTGNDNTGDDNTGDDNTGDDNTGDDNTGDDANDQPHEHEFVVSSTKAPTCTKEGTVYYECSCGEKKQEAGDAPLGHNYVKTVINEPTCGTKGTDQYKCSGCKHTYMQSVDATGLHEYTEKVEASRLTKCVSCGAIETYEYEGKYDDVIVYTFSETDLELFDSLFADMCAIIEAAEPYDPELHAYTPGSYLESDYKVMEAKYEELYDVLEYIVCQYQIAQIEYHLDMKNPEKQEIMDYISGIRTELVAEFYSFSEPLYNSMYREYYYYGLSEEEIQEFLFDSSAIGDEEYQRLTKRNAEIELEYYALGNAGTDPQVLDLYYEFVQNNKRIAEIMGYDNYLEYAYKNVYDRDYEYTDVAAVVQYVKEYIVPVYIYMNDNWNTLSSSSMTAEEKKQYSSQLAYSFFDNYDANVHLNDYIDLLAFTSNENKQFSFSDELNNLFMDGNLFRGNYEGAYVTSLYGINTPIAYFGPGYSNPFTVAHEFGHYMNEIYNGSAFGQSYDLLEMHSQGNEMLYLNYLQGVMSEKAFALCEAYSMRDTLSIIIIALIVDTFEQAVYTDSYDGMYAYSIMADNTITADEYDALFKSIIMDFGVGGYINAQYWRYVTLPAPCYYVSYSISAISVLQLYPMASADSNAAIDAYLKLFTYTDTLTDESDYMTAEEVLEYAGLYSYTDEELYKSIYNYFIK